MFKVTNKLEHKIKYKNTVFKPKETKFLEEKPYSDKFHVEENEEQEKPKSSKGGKK